jgi:nucleoside-diphosphate-sugar epimerase
MVGSAFADWVVRAGHEVWGTSRSPQKCRRFSERGWKPILFDWHRHPDPEFANEDRPTEAWPEVDWPEVDWVAIAVSHSPVENLPPEQSHTRGLERLFGCLPPSWSRCVYLSTTGVLAPGDSSADESPWLTESSPVDPRRPGAVAAAAAEQWLASRFGTSNKISVLRLAGLYGPGRIPNENQLRTGDPLRVDPSTFLNLIHVEDAVGVMAAVFQHSSPPALLHCCDGNPVLRREYYEEICRAIGAPPPRFAGHLRSSVGSHETKRGFGDKRVSNQLLRSSLGYAFRFPSFREGLLPLLARDAHPPAADAGTAG